MPSLPDSVPHDEWQVHLRSVYGVMEELLRRVRRLEEHGPVAGTAGGVKAASLRSGHESSWPHSCELSAQLVELHRVCREEVATQSGLEAAGARFDLHTEAVRRRMDQGFEELRVFVASEVEALRSQHDKALAKLSERLDKANEDIDCLRVEHEAAVAHTAAACATKVELREAYDVLRTEQSAASETLRAAADELEALKASREELQATSDQLSSDHRDLHGSHADTRQFLESTSAALAEHQRSCNMTFATLETMASTLQTIADVQDVAREAAEDRQHLRSDAAGNKALLDDGLDTLSTHGRDILGLTKRSNDLDLAVLAARTDLGGRLDSLDRALKALDRRERGSWEQFAAERR